ncbi:MAG: T9SS type A sorting domain-containing protein [Bacteroidota bacterium]
MKTTNTNTIYKIPKLLILTFAMVLAQYSFIHAQTYLAEGFSSAVGTTPPVGWTNVAGPGQTGPVGLWDASNPGVRTITGGDFSGKFLILDSDILGSGNTQDARLTTPPLNLTTATNPLIIFSEQFRFAAPQTGILEYSINGGTTWTALLTRTANYGFGNPALKTTIPVPGAAGQANVRFRWNILTTWGYWWAIDSVVVREAVVPAPPTTLTFSAVGASNTTINWVDNSSTETSFHVYRSTDNVNFTLASTVTSSTTATTGNPYNYVQTGLNPGTTYYYRVTSFIEGESTPLSGSQLTTSAGVILSSASGGNWGDVGTWVGGVIPTATDSVVIVNGATVTINTTTAACHALTVGQGVSGYLVYDAITASTLTVQNGVTVNTGATFEAGTGTTTSHVLRIGGSAASDLRTGNLIVNGMFDMQTTAGVTVTFFGLNNAQIAGTPTLLDFRSITVNKGAVSVNRPILTINAPFTVQGANIIGLIGTHTAGLVRINGTFTQSNPMYSSDSYTIPTNGGLHLNNPNFTVIGTNGSPVCNGLLQVTQGIFNISQTAAQSLDFGTGATFTVDGGTVNAAARISTGNTITFNFSSGNINVATVGNSTSGSASFGITSGASTLNWSGGTITLVQRSTGGTILDYSVAPTSGLTGGTLQVGNGTTTTNFNFNIGGNVPNLVIDNTTNNKTAQLSGQLNVWGTLTVSTGATLNMYGYPVLAVGTAVINNGFIDGRMAGSNFVFFSSTSAQSYSGTGIDSIQTFANQNSFGAITFNKPVVAYRVNFFSTSGFVNSANITLGNGLTQAVTVQIGVANFTGTIGTFDVAPVYNLGTGTYSLIYQQQGTLRTTGVEIPPSRSIYDLTLSDTNNVTLAGGALDVTNIFTLNSGRLNTSATNVLRLTNTAVGALSGGSATSYVNGPLQRKLPASLITSSTYTFPVGKGTTYGLFEMVNPGTNAGGTVDVLVERFNVTTGGIPDGTSINTLTPQYWSISFPAGATNIDSTTLRLTASGLVGINRVAYSSTLTGTYNSISVGPGVGTITSNKLVGSGAIEGFFSIGEIIVPISGNFLIGASKTTPDYTSLTAAMADISSKQVQGNITLLLDVDYNPGLETFPISMTQFAANNVNHTVTIKPNTGVNAAITGSHATTIIRLTNNARNYIIDGSNNGTTSRNLFIQNNNAGGAVVMFQGTAANQGVQNSTLKNTLIKGGSNAGAYGIIVGGTAVSNFSGGFGHKNITIENNNIYNNNYAVVISGTSSTNKVSSTLLLKNEIGTDSAAFYNQTTGVYINNADSITLSRNIIKNVKTTGSINNSGITVETNTTNCIISGNTIKGIYSTSSGGWGAYGMNFPTNTGVDNITVRNNAISDVLTSNYTLSANTAYNAYGIRILGGSNLKFYFNTVHLFGQPTTGSNQSSSAALTILSNTLAGLDMRDNIFSNKMTGTVTGSKHYAIATYGAITGNIFDYNNFIANSTQGVLMTQYNTATFTSADVTTLPDLKVATAANTNSLAVDPQFVNDSTLVIGLGTVNGLGTPIAGITLDIVDSVRATPPTMGAYEKGVDVGGPTITYTPLTNTFTITNRVLTGFASITDYSGVNTTATTKPRIYYRKSTDANAFGTYPADNGSSFNGWKYVEASNATSPFNFTIDYSLIFGGAPLIVTDTILYFVTAQDLKVPTFNISANPSTGFAATNVNTITSAPTTPNRYVIVDAPMAGTYLVGASQSSPNFTTLTSAITSLNSRGVSALVTFELTDATYTTPAETFPIVINSVTGGSATNRVIIKPTASNTATISGSSSSSLIKLNGTSFVKIDGSNNLTSSMDLTLQNTNTSGSVVHIASIGAGQGSTNDTICNTRIMGNSSNSGSVFGIFVGDGTIGNAGTDNANITILNDSIYKVGRGIAIKNTTSAPMTGIRILKNVIGGNPNPANSLYDIGMDIDYATAPVISGNTISNVQTTAGLTPTGVLIAGTTNLNFNNNKVIGIKYLGTDGYGSRGLNLTGTANTNSQIVNNFFAELLCDGDGGNSANAYEYNLHNIIIGGGANHKILFNSIWITGNRPSNSYVNASAIGVYIFAGATGLDIRNNIFQTNQTSSNGTPGFGYGIYSVAPATAFTDIDYNDYFSSSATAGISSNIGFIGAANQATLAAWKTATGKDVHSSNDTISFVSTTDLHLTGTSLGNLNLKATPIAGTTTDIDGETRHLTSPYMGADENLPNPLPVRLTLFTANTDKDNVLLNWNTASETNNLGFEIERSLDSRSFEKVDFVKGAGNSNRELRYAYTDVDAFSNVSVLYYRLKQVDRDGQYNYSHVVRVTANDEKVNALSVYPNPFTTDYSVSFNATSEGVSNIEMVDIQGRTVLQQSVTVVSGNNIVPFTNVNRIENGIYFVRVTKDGETQVIKLVKQN